MYGMCSSDQQVACPDLPNNSSVVTMTHDKSLTQLVSKQKNDSAVTEPRHRISSLRLHTLVDEGHMQLQASYTSIVRPHTQVASGLVH